MVFGLEWELFCKGFEGLGMVVRVADLSLINFLWQILVNHCGFWGVHVGKVDFGSKLHNKLCELHTCRNLSDPLI